ncbi:MAG: AAA family ATPase [Blastocatellia bacterium]|nr:MAG: AAA family ATPase [Blastocatellia bacterium]
MYEPYYGLNERPFDLSPNPRFLFLSNTHREALTHLRYGLTGRPGLTVLIGEAGTGKTTLVRAALQHSKGPSPHSGIVHLSNPTLTRSEFFEYLSAGFGFTAEAASSKTRFLREVESAISSYAANNAVLALVVDEAQSLPHELLEEIRLLTNVEVPSGQSLAVALVGQPELGDRLNEPRLRQLKQRIALRCELAALDLRETAAYIAARVRIAGGRAELLFTREAVVAIHECSKGIPRTISVICDNALVNGFAADIKPVGRDLVLEVCRDFQFGGALVGERADSQPSFSQPAGSAAARNRPPQSENPDSMFGRFMRTRRFSFF